MPDLSHSDAPFIVEHLQLDRTPSGSFRPAARLVLAPALRSSGLWAALPPEDFRNLILLLTFLSANGNCQAAIVQLAEAMGVSQAKARNRMRRLTQTQWRGRPLASMLSSPNGLDAFAPGRQLFADEHIQPPEPAAPPLPPVAGREAVIAHSRSAYAKSREEVEREIAARMGWEPPSFAGEDPAVAESRRRAFKAMTDVGMPRDQALDLLTRFDLAAIERQLAWLPARRAKSPSRLLAAAIEGDYEMPPSLRRQAPQEEAQGWTQESDRAPDSREDGGADEQTGKNRGDDPPQDGVELYRA